MRKSRETPRYHRSPNTIVVDYARVDKNAFDDHETAKMDRLDHGSLSSGHLSRKIAGIIDLMPKKPVESESTGEQLKTLIEKSESLTTEDKLALATTALKLLEQDEFNTPRAEQPTSTTSSSEMYTVPEPVPATAHASNGKGR